MNLSEIHQPFPPCPTVPIFGWAGVAVPPKGERHAGQGAVGVQDFGNSRPADTLPRLTSNPAAVGPVMGTVEGHWHDQAFDDHNHRSYDGEHTAVWDGHWHHHETPE
jgi:hypothetical protein